jgi:hypothetical protein
VCRRIKILGTSDGRDAGNGQSQLRGLKFDFEQTFGEGKNGGGKAQFKPTDLVLLSNIWPERQEDLGRTGEPVMPYRLIFSN